MATPNMGLVLPAVGVTIGPTWAVQLNAALDVVDAHDHSPGNGVQLTPEAINIDSALPFNGNDAESVGRVELVSQPATTLLPASVYVVAGDLFYNNSAGQPVQLTIGNVPAAGGGSISGMTGGASASYDNGTKAFIWNQSAGLRAALDAGAMQLREAGVGSGSSVTLAAPTSGVTSYTLRLPPVAPAAATQLLGGTSPGSTLWLSLDGSTLELSGTTLRVKPFGITATQLDNDSVSTAKIVANAVTGAKIGLGNTNGVQTANIADLAITTAKVAANAVTGAKIGLGNTDGVQTLNLADLAVTTVKLAANAVTGAKIGLGNTDGVQSANIADLAITTAKVAANAVTGAKIGLGNTDGVQTANIADLAISTAKIAANAVTGAKIGLGNTNGVQSANLADGAVVTAKIGAAQVTTAKIATGNTDGIQTANIADLAISTAKIAANAVTGAKIGTGNTNGVQTANLADLAVVEAKIGSLAVTEAKIGGGAVTNTKLGALAVTEAKVQDAAITPIKIAKLYGYGSFTNILSAYNLSSVPYSVAATNTQKITLTGDRPFMVAIQGDTGASIADFSFENQNFGGGTKTFVIDVQVYSDGAAAIVAQYQTKFVIKGNLIVSVGPLSFVGLLGATQTNCYARLRLTGDGTDIWLFRLINMTWKLWQ